MINKVNDWLIFDNVYWLKLNIYDDNDINKIE